MKLKNTSVFLMKWYASQKIRIGETIAKYILYLLLSYPYGKNSICSREIVQYRTMGVYADTKRDLSL
jgi:hypothetical protein